MIGALTFSLLWVAAKLIFVTYNEYATVYTKLYGSLLEVILLLLLGSITPRRCCFSAPWSPMRSSNGLKLCPPQPRASFSPTGLAE